MRYSNQIIEWKQTYNLCLVKIVISDSKRSEVRIPVQVQIFVLKTDIVLMLVVSNMFWIFLESLLLSFVCEWTSWIKNIYCIARSWMQKAAMTLVHNNNNAIKLKISLSHTSSELILKPCIFLHSVNLIKIFMNTLNFRTPVFENSEGIFNQHLRYS